MHNVPDAIKELLHLDSVKKNIRIHFPNGERSDICNDLIVKDSVSFTESICSQNTFVFGLAESPIFECEVVGVGNIKNATIDVSCEIFCDSSVSDSEWKADIQQYIYSIPYGRFYVKSCERQADMIHRKIEAYGFLSSSLTNGFSRFEISKLSFSAPATFVYTPSPFLLSLANFNLRDYDHDVFTAVSVANTTTTSGTERSFTWYPATGGHIMTAYVKVLYKTWKFDPINLADHLYILDLTRRSYEGVIAVIENLLQIFYGYTRGRQVIRDEIPEEELKYNVVWPVVNSKYIQESEQLPFIFYPYLNNYDVTINVPYAVNLRVPDVLRPLNQDVTCSENISLKRLDQQYYDVINGFKLNFACEDSYTPAIDANYNNRTVFEDCLKLIGCFAKYNESYIKLIDIKLQYELLAATNLYPSNSLYPGGDVGGSILPQDYQSCWYDDNYSMPYGCIRVYFTDYYESQLVREIWVGDFDEYSDINSYQVYLIDESNFIIKNTRPYESAITTLCNALAQQIEGVTYMPYKLVGRGLPYVEPGDTFEVLTKSNDSITTIVLSRTLKGEMTLTDEYTSVS